MSTTASDLVHASDRTGVGLEIRTLYCPSCDRYSGGGSCRRCADQVREFGRTLICSREHDGVRCRGNLWPTRYCDEQGNAVTALQCLQCGHEADAAR